MLTIYIEDAFLEQFEKLPKDKSYGVQFLWELAEENAENNLFIFDSIPIKKDSEYYDTSSEYKLKINRGNLVEKTDDKQVYQAHLFFVTEETKSKVGNLGIAFTLQDFEQRIEDYAKIDNFIDFLEEEKVRLFEHFNKFPHDHLYLVDEYFFENNKYDSIAKINKDVNLLNELKSCKSISIYSNSTVTYYDRQVKLKQINKIESEQKKDKIRKRGEWLNKLLDVNNISIYMTKPECASFKLNLHDRTIISQYCMLIAGPGFKLEYDKNTNNKLLQFNIFTINGRRLIRDEVKKLSQYNNENNEEDILIYRNK